MKISLIITTYNNEDFLNLSIMSALQQTRLPDEIIIADDGSGAKTSQLVTGFQQTSPVPIHHSWQEDQGFRAARSRNQAIALAKGEYIVLIDGDIILERHFIQDHGQVAEKNSFIQGSRILLDAACTQKTIERVTIQWPFFTHGLIGRHKAIRSSFLSQLSSRRTRSWHGVRTCNFAFWKQDALLVNGFNEAFVGWGREDSEFAARLLHRGMFCKKVTFKAICYHLYHPQVDRGQLLANDLLLQKTIDEKLLFCKHGLNQHVTRLTMKADDHDLHPHQE